LSHVYRFTSHDFHGHKVCTRCENTNFNMEKKITGIILTVLGIAGLIVGQIYLLEAIGPNINSNKGSHALEIIVFGIGGLALVFAGLRTIRNNRSAT
jgi:hypothetical protein